MLIPFPDSVKDGIPCPSLPWKHDPCLSVHNSSSTNFEEEKSLNSFGKVNSYEEENEENESLLEMASEMWLGVLMVCLVSVLQHLAVVKYHTREFHF